MKSDRKGSVIIIQAYSNSIKALLEGAYGNFLYPMYAPMLLFLFGFIYGNEPTPFFGGRGFIDSQLPAPEAGKFHEVIIHKLERMAREISTYNSTSIEENPLPLTDVKQIIKNKPEDLRSSEQEIINYNSVLEELNINLKKQSVNFDINLILSVHKKIINELLPKYQFGKLRKEPVFVNNPKTGKTVYWPPDQGDVPELVDNLLDFVIKNKDIVDPLIAAGIFHKLIVDKIIYRYKILIIIISIINNDFI